MKDVLLSPRAQQELDYWAQADPGMVLKIFSLIRDIQRDPFRGLGKPEPMRHKYRGLWSRRITQEHRLVYSVTDENISVVSCRFHYDK